MLSQPICLGCHKTLTPKTSKASFYRCSRCAWPLCSRACESLGPHIEECKLMTDKHYKCPIKSNCVNMQSEAIYCLIFPLRFLLLKRNQPKVWANFSLVSRSCVLWFGNLILDSKRFWTSWKVMWTRDSPRAATMASKSISCHSCKSFWALNTFQSGWFWQPPQYWTTIALRFACLSGASRWADCSWRVSFYATIAYQIRSTLWTLSSLMLTFSATKWHFKRQVSGEERRMKTAQLIDVECIYNFHPPTSSTVPVKKGEHLTTTYTDTLKSTLERRRHLSQTKIFDCDCRRCRDPSELSTNLSSWKCGRCGGLIVSSNPQNNQARWVCENCKSQLSSEVRERAKRCDGRHGRLNSVRKFNLFWTSAESFSGFPSTLRCNALSTDSFLILFFSHPFFSQEITSKLSRLQSQLNSFIKKCPERLEEFVLEHSQHIHSDHALLVEVKYMLCLMYGNVVGYQYKGLTFQLVFYIFSFSFFYVNSEHVSQFFFPFLPLPDLSEQLLQRKIELCENLLRVYGAIDPGETDHKTNVTFELNCATIIQTKIKLQQSLVRKEEAMVRTKLDF